ncbi:MAG: VWA domain-containing protein, partial [Chitinophagales bacterium]|nr:VWA domain-containing protein [Chitinophagales bacterium]
VNEFKNHIMAEIGGIIAFSAITNNDKVGVIFFSDQIEKFIPPKKGKSHIMRIINDIYDFEPIGRGTDIGMALELFNNAMKKKCISFLISDFITNKPYHHALSIASRKHDLIGIQIYDPREAFMPDVGLLHIEDAESGQEFWLNTSSKEMRKHYQEAFELKQNEIKETFGKCRAELTSIRTDENYIVSLMNMFKKREMRR